MVRSMDEALGDARRVVKRTIRREYDDDQRDLEVDAALEEIMRALDFVAGEVRGR